MSDVRSTALGGALHQLSRILLSDRPVGETLVAIADIARRAAAPHTTEVSISLLRRGTPMTAAATGQLALHADELQYACDRGPCIEALRRGAEIHIHDMVTETRWPDYTAAAADIGARSAVSIPLAVGDAVIGALNLYSSKPDGFGPSAIDDARDFASYAAIAVHNARVLADSQDLARQMQEAAESRAVIEQAKGIIMGDRRCTPDEAFAILVKLSQDANRKLREVALALVEKAQTTPRP